jgi:hypothetical protein
MNESEKYTPFSYVEYRKIVELFKPIIKDFSEINHGDDNYCLLRHDVEFLMDRAIRMAEIDYEMGVQSSFFIQVMNSAYNPLSIENKNILKKILDFGHNIGLHLYLSHIDEQNPELVINELNSQASILEICLEKKIDRFSYHRPPKWTLPLDLSKDTSLINAYSNLFFEYLADNKVPEKIKYFSDSNHNWSYGHPLEPNPYNCFQLCIHPDEWSEDGGDDIKNFSNILEVSRKIFMDNIDSEYKTFAKIRKQL